MDLIGDLGGTNLRLARIDAEGRARDVRVLRVAAHAGLAEAVRHYLHESPSVAPRRAAFAVAAPVDRKPVRLTNAGWSFTGAGLREALGLSDCRILNDFEAQALGTAALVPTSGRWVPVAGEGGHMSLPAVDAHEDRIVASVRERFGHCSAERLVSGPGLLLLYRTIAELAGRAAEHESPKAVSRAALENDDPIAAEALQRFFAMLGGVAGDLALAFGARGGVYLSGGILPGMADALVASAFRERFVAKGRFERYLDAIPTRLVVAQNPALIGLAALLADMPGSCA